jgi:hypothetical protein
MKQYKDTPYYITEDGKVFRDGKELFGTIIKKGYRMVSILGEKKYVHRLVSQLFVNNPEDKPQVNHIDSNKLNNHYTNLEWVTNQENRNHAVLNGLHPVGEDGYKSKLTESDVKYIRENYIPNHPQFSGVALCKKFGVSNTIISKIVNNKKWKHLSSRHSW